MIRGIQDDKRYKKCFEFDKMKNSEDVRTNKDWDLSDKYSSIIEELLPKQLEIYLIIKTFQLLEVLEREIIVWFHGLLPLTLI